MRAEWTKLRTLPSTAWLLLAVVVATVLIGAFAAASVDTDHCPTVRTCGEDLPKLSFTGVWLGQVAVVVIAVLTITGEYGTGTIQPTLTAVPRRLRVVVAKVLVLLAAVLVTGVLGVAGSLLIARPILARNGFTAANGYPPVSLSDGLTLRAAAGTVLYLAVVALLAFALGLLLRETAAAIATTLALLFVLPTLATVIDDPVWQHRLQRWSPMNAGLAIQSTIGLDRLPIGPWEGLGLFASYAAGALLLASVAFVRRDA